MGSHGCRRDDEQFDRRREIRPTGLESWSSAHQQHLRVGTEAPDLPVDMLSPGDRPSRRPAEWSRGCGLVPGVLGGCGGGRLGLWRGGLGVGRALVRVPASEGGEDRQGALAIWAAWLGEAMVA